MAAPELQDRLDHALRLCEAGAYAEAEEIYRALTTTHPGAPDAWNMLAAVRAQQGNFDDAADAAARATQLRPGIAPYWLIRGNVAFARQDHAEAQQSFERAIAIAPGFAEAHYRLGLTFHRQYRYSEAIAAFRNALRYAPDVAEIHWQCAEALIALERLDEAMRAYQAAFQRDPQMQLDRRGALEWLGRLHFESLPPWWFGELERFFERKDIDRAPYVRAGLKALKTRTAFLDVLARAERADALHELDAALREVMQDRLLRALLRDCLIADAAFERFLARLRSELLLSETVRAHAPLDFLCALALQSHNNEFVHALSEREAAAAAALAAEVERILESGGQIMGHALRALLVVACYRRLSELRGIDRLLAPDVAPQMLAPLLECSVVNPRLERALREEIPSLAVTSDDVSRAVRGLYEEHPYPRWFAVDRDPPVTLSEWVSRELPAMPGIAAADSPEVLVAGCGTGRDAMWLALNIASARVLAVDLSLSSLAYAQRMARMLGVSNIEFRQADILALPGIDRRFDLIASTGVLHHMREPLKGLSAIASLLRPGGLMRLGFYSARARVSVSAARAAIAAEGIASTEPAIRTFRQRVFEAGRDSPLKELEFAPDFYSTSMCRDLLFHVQEHQYTLPQLGSMLAAVGLEFLGLAELTHDTVGRYRRMFPQDPQMIDIDSWDRYEQQYPDTFSHMFLLWCRAGSPADASAMVRT